MKLFWNIYHKIERFLNGGFLIRKMIMRTNGYLDMEKRVEVLVLTSAKCPYCPKTINLLKQVSKRFKELVWKTLDVDTLEARRLIRQMGIESVPAILINGKLHFVGLPKKPDLEKRIKDILTLVGN